MTKKLIFVYNADSGFISQLLDGLHKNFKPSTYQCQLCALTYGHVSMKKEWKAFADSLPYEIEFLYKDQFKSRHPKAPQEVPSVFIESNNLTRIIAPDNFAQMANLEELKRIVQERT